MWFDIRIKIPRITRAAVLACLAAGLLTACRTGTDAKLPADDAAVKADQALSISTRYQPEDLEILEKLLNELAPYRDEPVSKLVVRAGRMFLNTPYVAHTLEMEQEELVVNLRELDCTTFAENCLALARTVRDGNPGPEKFVSELLLIRYRDGQLDGYPSRLHYFCDWIRNNDQKGLVEECAAELGGNPLQKEINFMSTHPENYRQLERDSSLVEVIRNQESGINQRRIYYIPEVKLGALEDPLKAGDIVGITTNIDGLAVMHVGILVHVDRRVHLLHASSAAGKVVVSEATLEEYLLQSQNATGIMVARPI